MMAVPVDGSGTVVDVCAKTLHKNNACHRKNAAKIMETRLFFVTCRVLCKQKPDNNNIEEDDNEGQYLYNYYCFENKYIPDNDPLCVTTTTPSSMTTNRGRFQLKNGS